MDELDILNELGSATVEEVDATALRSLLPQLRAFLYPRWQQMHAEQRQLEERVARLSGLAYEPPKVVPSYGMSKFAAAFLIKALHHKYGGRWTAVGGLADQKGGLFGSDEEWHDHFWVQYRTHILDIAADAYGYPAVIVGKHDDPRYHRTLSVADMKVLFRDNSRRIDKWFKEWKEFQSRSFI